ncbi:PRC-barrel domain-containing protein [Kitasatospora sp. NBC_01250]|uniref:PRC-barrel domain-containing protein n=1 Tax=Kitasatospora sp. NBC_01250 TaxID=2903571 RepID=UPI002E357C18|nr:PRC-barrel domain-containing protein [Kitasatospora sp. NBC_01250]
MQYAIGAEVHCPDGTYGQLKRVVIEPQSARVTHLVIGGRDATDRLVPVDIVDGTASDSENIRLFRDTAAVAQLAPAEETEYLAGADEQFGYEPGQWLVMPPAGLGGGGAVPMPLLPDSGAPHTVVRERVPGDEVQIRKDDRVVADDGEVGRVQGLLVDPRDQGVTHVLLKEGHLWGRKTVAIPIDDVSWQAGVVTTRLSKAQLADLPPVDIDSRP